MTPETRRLACLHAQAEHPREACGLVLVRNGKEIYQACRNTSSRDDEFVMHPDDYALAESKGDVTAIVHSHPYISAEPSDADRAACEHSGVPWHIVSLPTFQWVTIEPSGWRAPLIGREFSHGVLDCYTLIRDWYAEEMKIELPNFYRPDQWWEQGGNLYAENYEKAGFFRVPVSDDMHPSELRHGDVILMHMAGSKVPNHGAVYLEDGTIIHHFSGRLSSRDPFGGQWKKHATYVLRHQSTAA